MTCNRRIRVEGRIDEHVWTRFRAFAMARHGGRSRIARGMSLVSLELEAALEYAMSTPPPTPGGPTHTQPPPHAILELLRGFAGIAAQVNPVQVFRAISQGLNIHDPRSIRGWLYRLETAGVLTRLDVAPPGTRVRFSIRTPTWTFHDIRQTRSNDDKQTRLAPQGAWK